MELTFAEQIKILLHRENRTIKEFAELMEARTGTRCSRQNVTQKLKRDNFQEQDMRMYAAVLGYKVQISLVPASSDEIADELAILSPLKNEASSDSPEESLQVPLPETNILSDSAPKDPGNPSLMETPRSVTAGLLKKPAQQQKKQVPSSSVPAPDLPSDCINPYNGAEYLANTVRKHPTLDRYIQVYDQTEHIWVDVAEDFFQKFQEQKRQLMGKDYTQPIYI